MIPYEQMAARADHKMARYRSDAEQHRMISKQRTAKGEGFFELARRALGASGLLRIGKILSGSSNGPVQPAV